MRIEKINYQKLYPIGNFLNERVGFEASIDENDDPQQALAQLKEMADKFHEKNNAENNHQESGESPENSSHKENSEPKPPQEIQIGNIEAGIRSCRDIKILETYRLIIKKDAGLQKAYDEMMEKLTPKE
jgi:hypothetical protein